MLHRRELVMSSSVRWWWANDRIYFCVNYPFKFHAQQGEEIKEQITELILFECKNLFEWGSNTYEYWFDSFLPMSGQLIFCRSIRMIQMKRIKFICCWRQTTKKRVFLFQRVLCHDSAQMTEITEGVLKPVGPKCLCVSEKAGTGVY